MLRLHSVAALLGSTALLVATPALAQDPAPAPAAAEGDSAKIARLEAQVEALTRAMEELKGAMVQSTPAWKGAPQLADEDSGWSFKPRGRLQYDFGYVGRPNGYDDRGLGFGNEIRRARLGVEGSVPGGFGYKLELDFASGDVEFADAYLSKEVGNWEFIVGQHNNFQSLEELTSSLHSTFVERAAFTDAFNFERRVGVSAQWMKDSVLVQGGLFTDSIADLNTVGDDNNGYGFDGRAVFMPKLGKNQLHFGASAHWRDLQDSATVVRYRQRPLVHTTDVRFIDTGPIGNAREETGYGLEAAGIFGPVYLASEAYWQKVAREGFADPTFFGVYVDAGYFFTGESRGYKAGKFDRVKVRNPFNKGGWGSLGANLRWYYLDLSDGVISGGKQNAFQLSLNWKPVDYVLFGLNVAHIVYDGAAIPLADGERDYDVNVAAIRTQVDF